MLKRNVKPRKLKAKQEVVAPSTRAESTRKPGNTGLKRDFFKLKLVCFLTFDVTLATEAVETHIV